MVIRVFLRADKIQSIDPQPPSGKKSLATFQRKQNGCWLHNLQQEAFAATNRTNVRWAAGKMEHTQERLLSAAAVIGGVVSSTLLTLVVVPVAYSLLDHRLGV